MRDKKNKTLAGQQSNDKSAKKHLPIIIQQINVYDSY